MDFRYGFGKKVDSSYDEARERVIEALKVEGFGVLTEIDVKATMKKKLDAEFRPYSILGACNPTLAMQALENESHIGLLLPCNVVVQEEQGGGATVSIADPRAMFSLVDNPGVAPLAEEVEARLRRVLDAL